ncbi:MAG: septum formation protein Maf [Lentisphaeria bacterium]|nr:septum formation protein Maf [Lentisphaeria bacterium]
MSSFPFDLILASASPRRAELLRSAGITDFRVIPAPDVEELDAKSIYLHSIALQNSEMKADAVAQLYPDSVVIGADTVIEFRDSTIGKPQSVAQAEEILTSLSGQTHETVTGVSILSRKHKIRILFTDVSTVTFKPYGLETIRDYMQKVHVLDKAGAYAIQEHGDMLVQSVKGSIPNIVGLPVERVVEALKNLV